MQSSVVELYIAKQSFIHHLDPRIKVVFTFLFIVSNVLLPDGAWTAFALTWGLILAINTLADLPPTYLLKRSLIALPFALAAITAIISVPGTPLATFSIGPWTLIPTDAGVIRFISIVIRSWISVQAAILLTAATQFPDLLHALRHLHLPLSLVAVISFTYRYLFVLTDEASRLLRARESRSAALPGKPGGGSITWRAKTTGTMIGQLFLRSYERSDRVYNAMLSRGYHGYLQTLNPHILHRTDWLTGGAGIVLLLLLQLVGRM